jgi:hypothetical protein
LLAHLKAFFNWAIERDTYGLESSPCEHLKATRIIGERRSEDRTLNDTELFAFWRATKRMSYPYGPFYRLLLLSGLRLNEVAGAAWDEYDLAKGIWTIPASRMKGKNGKARPQMEDAVHGFLLLYDSKLPDHWAQAEKDIDECTFKAWMGFQEDSQYVREIAAALMERGDPLPERLRYFVEAFLRNPNKPNLSATYIASHDRAYIAWLDGLRAYIARRPGRGSSDLVSRNIGIWAAMEHIVKTWKFPATRNEATKDKGKRASAASIVREAIKKGAGVHLSEAAVVKAWNKMRLAGEQALALDPAGLDLIIGPSEKIPTD